MDTRLRTGPLPGTVNTVSDVPERWTKASVYPDMWADPGEDPRNSEGVSPDGELATLQDYVRNYRLTLLMKCEGLDPGQLACRSVPPSTMSLLGLIRHLAEGERSWRNWIARADPAPDCTGRATPPSRERLRSRRRRRAHSPTWPASRRQPMRCWPGTRT